jgi:hypothetical protein
MIDFKEYLTKYKLVIDEEVAGYFYPVDIVMIYALLSSTQKNLAGDVCEIGVAEGKSAICISNFKRPEDNFYLYDIFSEEQKNIAEKNLLKFGNCDNIHWRLQDTTELKSENLKFERPLRFLHIDGCHEHDAVLNDLVLFSYFMHDDGIILMDDYNDYEFPGVNSATMQFCLSKYNVKNWRVISIGDNKAYLCQKKNQEIYQKSLINFMTSFNSMDNKPFKIKMGLRQLLDINCLLCDSREDWDSEKLKTNLFNKPEIR